MANLLPNQPIVFNQDDNCWLEDSGIKLLAQYGDITQFQMGLEPCLGDRQVIQDGNFTDASNWILGSGWAIGGGSACHSVALFGFLTQVIAVTDGVLLRLNFTLDVSDIGCTVHLGTYVEVFTVSGSYERWIVADTVTSFSVSAPGSSVVCVSSVSVITINTNFETWVVDDAGVTVSTLTDGDFTNGYFTQAINWQTLALPDGCYTLQVFDPCPCSQGGIIALDFVTGVFNWDLGASWTMTGNGVADYSGTASSLSFLRFSICTAVEYTVKYTLLGMTANAEFRFRLGSTTGATRTINGIYTENLTSTGTSVTLIGDSSAGTSSFTLSDVSIVVTTKTATYVSTEIFLQEELGCQSLAMALCNDSDALGFGFLNTGFRPLMRIPASLVRSSYPMERLAYEYSTGRKTPYYARSRKARDLQFGGKEFMHDFGHLFGMADHFYIDDIEMFVEDDEYPSIGWDEQEDSGVVTLQVSIKVQLIENKRISSSVAPCVPGGSPLVDDDGEVIVDGEDGTITDG